MHRPTEAHKHYALWNDDRDRLTLEDDQGELHGVITISAYAGDSIEPATWSCRQCGATGEAASYPDAWSDFLDHERAAHP